MVREALTAESLSTLDAKDVAALFIARRAEGLTSSEQHSLADWLAKDQFHQCMFEDADHGWHDLDEAEFMANSQVPWGVRAVEGTVSEAAWRAKPSWYMVATDDRMIPPPAQQSMSKRAGSTVVESKGSHAIYVSQPAVVAALIERAARESDSTSVASRVSAK